MANIGFNNKDKIMTKEEYQKKINELNEQKRALDAQIEQVHKEFGDSLLMELEEQGINFAMPEDVNKCDNYIENF